MILPIHQTQALNINYIAPRAIDAKPVLREELAQRVANAHGRQGLQSLDQVVPTASLLFHELIHLVRGSSVTRQLDGPFKDLYGTLACLGLPYARAKRNCDSYVLSAVAYDYTRNEYLCGEPVEFFSGFATTEGTIT
jgi:hypothetical protein